MAINVIRNDSLVELVSIDGTKITGTVCDQGTNTLCVRLADGSRKDITQEMISSALYFYIGYPKESTIIQVPDMIIPNGKIESFNAKTGFAIDSEGRRLVVHLDSFLFDDELPNH